MKVLIQNCFTLEYLCEDGTWSLDAARARDFKSSNQALDYCMKHKPRDVHIVLKFDRSEYDIKSAYSDSCKDPAAHA